MPPKSKKAKVKGGRGVSTAMAVREMTNAFAGLSVGEGLNFLPLRRVVKQNYVCICNPQCSATANTYGTAVDILLNSVFAPGGTSGAHQPYGFDTLAAQYQRYKVHAIDWEFEITNPPATADPVVVSTKIGQPGFSYTIGATTTSILLEKPQTQTAIIVPGSPFAVRKLRGRVSMHKVLGLTELEYAANLEDYSALVSASPSRVLTLQVAVSNMVAATQTQCYGYMRLYFTVEYFQPTVVAQS